MPITKTSLATYETNALCVTCVLILKHDDSVAWKLLSHWWPFLTGNTGHQWITSQRQCESLRFLFLLVSTPVQQTVEFVIWHHDVHVTVILDRNYVSRVGAKHIYLRTCRLCWSYYYWENASRIVETMPPPPPTHTHTHTPHPHPDHHPHPHHHPKYTVLYLFIINETS